MSWKELGGNAIVTIGLITASGTVGAWLGDTRYVTQEKADIRAQDMQQFLLKRELSNLERTIMFFEIKDNRNELTDVEAIYLRGLQDDKEELQRELE